jgi:hypothetical protein
VKVGQRIKGQRSRRRSLLDLPDLDAIEQNVEMVTVTRFIIPTRKLRQLAGKVFISRNRAESIYLALLF